MFATNYSIADAIGERKLSCSKVQIIPRVLQFPFLAKSSQPDQLRQIAGGRRRGGIGDRPVICRAEAAPEAVRSLGEHPEQGLFLPCVDAIPEAVEQLRLGQEEMNPIERALLGRERDVGEPFEPVVDPVGQTRSLKPGVIVLVMALTRLCKGRDRRCVKPLGQGLFRDRPAEATVAILEGMDGLEP